jgi:adenylate cyclase
MTTIVLEQVGGPLQFRLMPGRKLVLGRSVGSDLLVPDPAVSRRHAELEATDDGVMVRDLGSANGTSVNGAAVVTEARLRTDDLVTFGSVAFRIRVRAPGDGLVGDLPAGTAVRPVPAGSRTEDEDRRARALDRLFEVAAGLSGDFSLDRLLDAVADLAFDQVAADRVAILLADPETGGLAVAASRSRVGEATPQVPRAIAELVVRDRSPVVTASAVDDERFQSGSVRLLAVRSAIAVPLLAGDHKVLGVLYADTLTRPSPFGDADAHALNAFAGLAAAAIGRARYAGEARREREVRANFERFFAPSVAAAIATRRDPVALGGARLPVAVLFSDIRGFTTMAESLPPEEIAAFLGEYFSAMVDQIFEHGGTLDKFIGDAVMAVWGAPLPVAQAADTALRAARAMRKDLTALNQRRTAGRKPPVEAGFGLAYGEVFAGNIGTDRRLEYTVVGDAVNLAFRLCAAAGPGEILVDEGFVARLLSPPALAAGADLPGKGRAIRAFRVLEA